MIGVDKIPNILVVGDLMIDHYLWGDCERISPEAPVQVVDVKKEESLLGGAGNLANNLLSLGAKVSIASVVGDDEGGEWLKERLKQRGIDIISLVKESGRKTTKKSRVIAYNHQIVRVDKESRKEISQNSSKEILDAIKDKIEEFDLVLLSDYNKGVLIPDLIQDIIALANWYNKPIFVDPKGSDYSKYLGATLITPNKKEASIATNIEIVDENSLQKAGKKLLSDLNLEYAFITLSQDGMAIFSKKITTKIPTIAREVFDVTGAGDSVLAALGYGYAKGMDIKSAANFANAAAAVVVSKVGSATATIEEIEQYQNKIGSKTLDSKVVSVDKLPHFKDKKVVFTNGCFDIIHSGHIRYLHKAKSFGDILVVGLNSDESVKRLKGESRPINTQEDRTIVLAGLESVDFVVVFDEDTPYELIKTIKPDILVKGGDYEGKEVVGSDIAKETRLVEFVDGKSTSKIIQRAKES